MIAKSSQAANGGPLALMPVRDPQELTDAQLEAAVRSQLTLPANVER